MHTGIIGRTGIVRWIVTLGMCAALQLPASSGAQVVAAGQMPVGATLTVLADPVQVAAGADGTFVEATPGQSLQAGDVIRTGPSGMALLTFFDGSESQLGESSQLQIEQADYTPAPQIALLQTNGVSVNRVIPLAPGGSFRTDTPEATGLVRGTSYVVSIGSDDTGAPATSMALLTDRDGHVGHVQVVPAAPSASTVDLVHAGDLRDISGEASQLQPEDLAQLESAAKDLHDVKSARKAHAQLKQGLEKPKHAAEEAHESSTAEAHEKDKDNNDLPAPAPSPAGTAIATSTAPPSVKKSTTTPSQSGRSEHQDSPNASNSAKNFDSDRPKADSSQGNG